MNHRAANNAPRPSASRPHAGGAVAARTLIALVAVLAAASSAVADESKPDLTPDGVWRMTSDFLPEPITVRIEQADDGGGYIMRRVENRTRLMTLRVAGEEDAGPRTRKRFEGEGQLQPTHPETGEPTGELQTFPVRGVMQYAPDRAAGGKAPVIELQWSAQKWTVNEDGKVTVHDDELTIRATLKPAFLITGIAPQHIRAHDGDRFTFRLSAPNAPAHAMGALRPYDFHFTTAKQSPSALVVTNVTRVDDTTLKISGDIRAARGPVTGPHRLLVDSERAANTRELGVAVYPSNTSIYHVTQLRTVGTTGLAPDAAKEIREAGPITEDTPASAFPTFRDLTTQADRETLAWEESSQSLPETPTTRDRQRANTVRTYLLHVVGQGLDPDRVTIEGERDDLVPDALIRSGNAAVRYEFVHARSADNEPPGADRIAAELARGRRKALEALGDEQKDSLSQMDQMLVLAHVEPGATPGVQTLQYNGAAGSWVLENGMTAVDLEIQRVLDQPIVSSDHRATQRFQAVQRLYVPDRFRIEVRAEADVDVEQVRVFLSRGGKRIDIGGQPSITADRVEGRADLFRTPPITLHAPDAAPSTGDGLAIAVDAADRDVTVQAFVRGAPVFRGPAMAQVTVRPTPPRYNEAGGMWEKALKEVARMRGVEMNDPLEFAATRETTISGPLYDRAIEVNYGHHAAMLLMKREFLSMLRDRLNELNTIDLNDDWAVFDFRRRLRARVLDGSYLGRLPVTPPGQRLGSHNPAELPGVLKWTVRLAGGERDYYAYADTFDPALLHNRAEFHGPLGPKQWMIETTRQVILQMRFGLKRAMQLAHAVDNNDPEALLFLTGVKFDAVEARLLPKLVKRAGDGSKRWVPHKVAHGFVQSIAAKTSNVKAQEGLANTKIDTIVIVMLPAALLSGPTGVVAGAVLSGAEAADVIANRIPEWTRQDRDLVLGKGARPVLGTGRYDLAKLERTDPFWRGLRAVGAVAGVAFDGAALNNVLRTAKTARPLERALQSSEAFDVQTLKQMGEQEKLQFFAVAAEARAAEQAGDSLAPLQRQAMHAAEQMTTDVLDQPMRWGRAGARTENISAGAPRASAEPAAMVAEPMVDRARHGLEQLGYNAGEADRVARGLLRRYPQMPPNLVQIAGAIENPGRFPPSALRERINLDNAEMREQLMDYLRRFVGEDDAAAAQRVRQYMGADEPVALDSGDFINMERIDEAPDMHVPSSELTVGDNTSVSRIEQEWEQALADAMERQSGRAHIETFIQREMRLHRANSRTLGRSADRIDGELEAMARRWNEMHEMVDPIDNLVGGRRLNDYENLRLYLKKGDTQTEALVGRFFNEYPQVAPARVRDELGLTTEQHVKAVNGWMQRYAAAGDQQAARDWIVNYFETVADEQQVRRWLGQ